jgi:hypothetical protein
MRRLWLRVGQVRLVPPFYVIYEPCVHCLFCVIVSLTVLETCPNQAPALSTPT